MRSSALWACLLVLAVPALADAQLLPRLPTWKRHKPPCEAEPPVYKLYRDQYYGYFPTCWRRFPPGWGCPSPEAPNFAADLQRQKLQDKIVDTYGREREDLDAPGFRPGDLPGDLPAGPEGGPLPPRGDQMPDVPEAGRSPFDLPDNRPPDDRLAPPADAPGAPGADRPGAVPPRRDDPFDIPPPTTAVPPASGELPPIAEPPISGPSASRMAPARPAPRRTLLSSLFDGRARR